MDHNPLDKKIKRIFTLRVYNMKRSLAFLAVLLIFSMLAASIPIKAQAQASLKVEIVTPHPDSIKNEYKKAFEAYYLNKTGTPVTVEYVDTGGTSDIIAYVDAAYAAHGNTTTNIDLWWGGGIDPFIDAKRKGHLVPYRINDTSLNGGVDPLTQIPNNISGIPMYDPDYMWYGQALSGFGIMYNKAVMTLQNLPVPKTWQDLTDPRLKGWVGSAVMSSGSTHMAYEIMMQGYGWTKGMAIATELAANVKTWASGSSAVPKSISAGDEACGLVIDYYAWAEVASVGADKIGYVLPEGLTVINPDAIGMLKGAPSPDLAKAFMEFVLSKTGQRLLMLPVGAPGGPVKDLIARASVMPSLYSEIGNKTVVPINPFTVKSQLPYNATLGSLRYVVLNDIITTTMIDSQTDLNLVWSQIISVNQTLTSAGVNSTKVSDAINKMCQPPVSEADALALAGNWSNPAVRNAKLTEWRNFAASKYGNASNQATLAGLDLVSYFNGVLNQLQTEKTNNLYMGLGGGTVIGVVIGVVVAYFMTRRREVAAVKA